MTVSNEQPTTENRKQKTDNRTMTKFLKHSILFLVVVITLFIGIYGFFSYNHVFSPSPEYRSTDFDKAFDQLDYDLIAIGNSKVLVSIDKAILEKELDLRAAILAYGSTDVSISKLTLEAYLNKAIKKPKLVLLEVSWFTFNTKRTHFSNLSGDLFLEDYHLINHIYTHKPKSTHNLREIIYAKVKTYFTGFKKQSQFFGDKRLKRNKITKRQKTKKTYTFNKDIFERVFPNHKAGIDPVLYDDYQAIIQMCTDSNINLVLFTAPESKDYALLQEDRKQIQDVFYTTEKSYQTIEYLNYSYGGDLYKNEFDNWLADSHHLKEKSLFTEVFVKDIKDRISDDLLFIK